MTYADAPLFFEQVASQLAPVLNTESREWLEELIVQGQEIIAEGLSVARKILSGPETLTLTEADQLDHAGSVTEAAWFLVLPMPLSEEHISFDECLVWLRDWHHDLATFLQEQKRERR